MANHKQSKRATTVLFDLKTDLLRLRATDLSLGQTKLLLSSNPGNNYILVCFSYRVFSVLDEINTHIQQWECPCHFGLDTRGQNWKLGKFKVLMCILAKKCYCYIDYMQYNNTKKKLMYMYLMQLKLNYIIIRRRRKRRRKCLIHSKEYLKF